MAKNILAVQTTTFQNRKADVYFRFFNCILLWTALEAMRVRLSAFHVDEGVMASHSMTGIPKCCSHWRGQSMQLLRVFLGISGLPWMLQWHQHRFAIHTFGNTVHDRGSCVWKAWLGCSFDVVADLLLFLMPCLFFLSLSLALALSSIHLKLFG